MLIGVFPAYQGIWQTEYAFYKVKEIKNHNAFEVSLSKNQGGEKHEATLLSRNNPSSMGKKEGRTE